MSEPIKVVVKNRPEYPKKIEAVSPKYGYSREVISDDNKSLLKEFEDYNEKVKDHYAFIQSFGRNEKYINLCIESCAVDFKTEFYEVLKSCIKDIKDQESIFHSQDIQDCLTDIRSFLEHMFKESPNDKNEAYALIHAKTLCRKIKIAFNVNGISDINIRNIIDYIIAFISVVYPHSSLK